MCESIRDKVRRMLAEHFQILPEEIDDDQVLGEDLGFDGLTLQEVMLQIEDDLDLSLSDEELAHVAEMTVAELIKLVERKSNYLAKLFRNTASRAQCSAWRVMFSFRRVIRLIC